MVLSILFGKKYDRSRIGSVTLDATINEEHNYTAQVTNYPLENGTDISDHIINQPVTVQITGIVSDTPLSLLSSFNRSIDAFNKLILIYERKERITVVTGIKVYTNMVMTNLQIPRDVSTGQSLSFSIELQKIYTDSTVRVNLDPNDPFNRTPDKIPREIVSNANEYPYFQQDPNTSFKDQASSSVNAGIQDLIPVPNRIISNVNDGLRRFIGVV